MSYKPLPKEERSQEVKRLEEDELEETKDISVRVMSSQSVLVTWTDPIYEKQKRPVSSSRQYTVRYREKGESARWDYKQIPNRRVLVDKLIPDTMYEFAVRISQGEREGKWSASVYQRTPEAAPTGAPENLNVWPIKGKTATVAATWDALPESEGKVKEYILSYAPALKPFGAKSISYPGDTTSALVEDLQPGERYIFKIRAANRRGQGPQSKAFSVAMPATNIGESNMDQQTNIEADLELKASKNSVPSSSVHASSAATSSSSSKQTLGHSSTFLGGRHSKSSASDLNNKLLAGSRVPTKPQESSRKGAELEADSHSRRDTADQNPSKEAPTVQPQNQDKSSVKPHSPIKPVVSSGKTPHRSRTPARTGQVSTDKHRSSPPSSSPHPSLSSIPNYSKIETKNLRQGSSKLPSSPETTLDNRPVDNESNDQVDSAEEKPKPPSVKHSVSHSDQQPSGSRKVAQNHPTKSLLPSVSAKSPASTNSQSHSHHPSYKLVPPDTSDAFETDKSGETGKREQRPGSRPSPPQGSSSPSVQTRPLLHSNRHVPRDPRVSAVAAAATHTLPHSHSSSAKRKAEGKEGSDSSDGGNDDREDEENRRRPSSSRFSSRPSSGLSASERFNLFKYRSALTANRYANRGNNIYGTRTPPSKSPSTTQSSKVQPQSSSHLTSGSNHRSSSNIDKEKELEDEDESPLPSTLPNAYSPPFSKQSSSVDYTKRRSSLAESKTHHRVIQENYSKEREATDIVDSSFKVQHSDGVSSVSSQSPSLSRTNHHSSVSSHLTNGHNSRSRGSSPSSDSLLRTSMEKSAPLQPPASKYQPDHLESKDTSPKSKQASPLSKKPLMGRSHALSRKTLHPETSHSSKAATDPSQHSRSHLTLSSHQSNEKLEDRDDDSLEENYYKEASDKEEERGSYSVPGKEVSTTRRISQGRTSALSKHSESQTSKSGQRSPTQRESLTSSRGLGLSPGKHTGSKMIASSEDTSDAYKLPASSHQSKFVQPSSTSNADKDHHHSRETSLFSKSSSTSLRQTHPSVPRYSSGSRVPTRTASQTDKKYGLLQPIPTKVELSPKMSPSKTHQLINSDEDYEDYDQSEREEKPTSPAAKWPSSSVSRGSKSLNNNVAGDKSKSLSPALPPKTKFVDEEEYKQEEEDEQPTSRTSNTALSRSTALTSRSSQSSKKLNTLPKVNLASPRSSGSTSGSSHLHPTHSASPTRSSSSSSVSANQRTQNSRLSNPSQRQQLRLPNRQGNGGRPNLTTKPDQNNKVVSGTNGKRNGQKIINGPQGIKWIVDLDRGLVLNVEGRYLQDSQGKPLRVKLGGDGRTIVDSKGAPVVSPDGLPLFGHGRFSKPVANAQDKPIISLGGKPLIGLEMVKKTTTPATTTTVRTTTATTTTTPEPTTPEPTTTEPPTEKPQPTCPPGTYAEYDEEGNIVLGFDGLPECNSEDTFSGLDADVTGTTESYVIYDGDYEFFETTLTPTTTTTTAATTTTEELPEFSVVGSDPLLEYDDAGKRRFTAPYVTYLNKDPAAPCSLTEALEHFQVESLAELIPSDLHGKEMRPQKAPHNITIVAVEGCHSFVIVDWAKPPQGDLVTGYLVYSASYDDFIRNKWSTKTAGSTNLPIENLKPNTRYYFRVQAKNPYGYGPISSSISYITESDNPLLIVRPPGGEPIWIPFSFKYDPTYSECSGKQYVKRTWYRKFVGVVLCNSLRYKIYLSDDLRDTFYSIGDSWGRGEDHCQFVDSHLDGRTGPQSYVEALPPIQGYYRQYRQEPVSFGRIGYMTPYYYVGWYECGVPIPGKW